MSGKLKGKSWLNRQHEKVFEQAKKAGKKASLVNQQRPNIFTNELANIPAYQTVQVTLKLLVPVTVEQNMFSLRLPTAMIHRYRPQQLFALASTFTSSARKRCG